MLRKLCVPVHRNWSRKKPRQIFNKIKQIKLLYTVPYLGRARVAVRIDRGRQAQQIWKQNLTKKKYRKSVKIQYNLPRNYQTVLYRISYPHTENKYMDECVYV